MIINLNQFFTGHDLKKSCPVVLDESTEPKTRLVHPEYSDILDRIQAAFPMIPWYISRGAASGLLACCDLINHTDIQIDVVNNEKRTSPENFSGEYLLAINAITERYNSLGKFFPKFASKPINEVLNKDTLVNIGKEILKLVKDDELEKLVKTIESDTSYTTESGNDVLDPIIMNLPQTIHENNPELTPNDLKQLKEAFGDILDGKTFNFVKSQNSLIELNVYDNIGISNTYIIDPSTIMAEGYDIFMYDNNGETVMANIKRNREIVKKYIDNFAYRLSPDEVSKVTRFQFKSSILYSVLDLSGMAKKLRTMKPVDKDRLEKRLMTIFFKSGIFTKYLKPKFRFKIFKNPDVFTLVCDEHTKNIIDTGTPMYPATIIVDASGYQISLKPNEGPEIIQDYKF